MLGSYDLYKGKIIEFFKKHKWWYTVILMAIFAAGLVTGISFENIKFVPQMERRLQGGYQFINPLLECDSNADNNNVQTTVLAKQLNSIITKEKETGNISGVAVYYRDLSNGPWFGINEDEQFTPASMLKVAAIMGVYKLAEGDRSLLNKKVTYITADDSYTQLIAPGQRLELGKTYTVEDLIMRTLVYSDNEAIDLLEKVPGINDWNFVLGDLGIPFKIDGQNFTISVKDYSSFFRILYNASYLDRNDSEQMLKIMSKADFEDGLVAGIPNDITVSHKFGEREIKDINLDELHDCGIVYKPVSPYLLCVMTKGEDLSDEAKVIGEISKAVYDFND